MSVDDDPVHGPGVPGIHGPRLRRAPKTPTPTRWYGGGGRKTKKKKTKNDLTKGEDLNKILDDFGTKATKPTTAKTTTTPSTRKTGTRKEMEERFSTTRRRRTLATRKLVEQHRRDGCSVSSISKAIFQRHTIGQTRIERGALDAVGVRV